MCEYTIECADRNSLPVVIDISECRTANPSYCTEASTILVRTNGVNRFGWECVRVCLEECSRGRYCTLKSRSVRLCWEAKVSRTETFYIEIGRAAGRGR